MTTLGEWKKCQINRFSYYRYPNSFPVLKLPLGDCQNRHIIWGYINREAMYAYLHITDCGHSRLLTKLTLRHSVN